jgi:hypothetical protein
VAALSIVLPVMARECGLIAVVAGSGIVPLMPDQPVPVMMLSAMTDRRQP